MTMMHLIMTQATLTDGTEGALAVVSPASLTVSDQRGAAFLRAFFSTGNDVVYSQISNNSTSFLTNPLKFPPHKSTDTDGIAYVKVPNIPLEGNSVFSVAGKTVAGA